MTKGKVTNDEIMGFLQEHMVMRADLENFMTKEDGRRLENRMFVLEDQQAKLIQTVQLELAVDISRMDRLEGRVHRIEGHIGLSPA